MNECNLILQPKTKNTKEMAQIRKFPKTTLSKQSSNIIAKIEKAVWKVNVFSDWETDLAVFLYSQRPSAKNEVLSLLKEERIDFDKYISRKDVSSLMGDYCAVIDFCLNPYEHQSYMSRRGEVELQPVAITKLCLSLLDDMKENDVIYNPFAGMASYPSYMPDVKFVGEEINRTTWALSQIRMDAFGANAEIALADSIANYRKNTEKYTAIITTPPFCIKGVVPALLYMAENNLRPDGSMLCLLPESFCTAVKGSWFDMRKTLIERGWLKAVIMLPAIFQETNINTCVALIEPVKGQGVVMVDASKDFVASQDKYYSAKPFDASFNWESVLWTIKNQDKRYCVAMSYEELDNKGVYLNVNPARYLFKLPEIEHDVKILSELARVESPSTLGNYDGPMLMGTDFSKSYLTCAISTSSIEKKAPGNHSLRVVRQNCMLAYVIGGKVKVGKITDIAALGGSVAVPEEAFIITRISDKISDDYLLKVLTEEYVGAQVVAYSTGITIKRIALADLERVLIPVPEPELQKAEIQKDLAVAASVFDANQIIAKNLADYKDKVRANKHYIGQKIRQLNSWILSLHQCFENDGEAIFKDQPLDYDPTMTPRDIMMQIRKKAKTVGELMSILTVGEDFGDEGEINVRNFIEEYIQNNKSSLFHWQDPVFGDGYKLEAADDQTTFIPTVFAKIDAKALTRVLDNIVSNAEVYGFKNNDDTHKMRISTYTNGEGVVFISVENNGTPISSEILPDVFTLGKTSSGGDDMHNGRGGYEVKEIIEHFGGTVTIAEPSKEDEYKVKYVISLKESVI